MTAISALIASVVAILMHTGSGIDLAAIAGKVTKEMKTATIAENILSFLPDNLFHQMNENKLPAYLALHLSKLEWFSHTLVWPWQLIVFVIGVDAIVDSFRTPLNIHGAMTTAIIVDKTTKAS